MRLDIRATILAFFLIAACKSTVPPPSVLPIEVKTASLQAEKSFPGITAAVVLKDGVFHKAASGFSHVDNRVKMKASDRLMSGSVGKTFVAAIVAKLIEEGRLEYDDPIEKWFSQETFFDEIPNVRDITIRMLLSHRSGWVQHVFESQRFLKELFENLETEPSKYYAPEELFRCVTYDKALFPAGADYHYSDMNYIALGLIVERITGKSYYEVLRERILKPFGLVNTIPADSQHLPGLINGYMRAEDPFAFLHPTSMKNGELVFNPSVEWTGGGLATNSGDLARWAKILWGAAWLSPESVDLLAQNHRYGGAIDKGGYGYGTEIWITEYGPVYGHSGYYPGYNTIMGYFPRYDVAAALQINRDHDNGPLINSLLSIVVEYVD